MSYYFNWDWSVGHTQKLQALRHPFGLALGDKRYQRLDIGHERYLEEGIRK